MISRLAAISAALVLVFVLAVGGCGRKGDLQPPKGEESTYTGLGTYPAPESVVPQGGESPAAPDPEADSETGPEGTSSP